HQLVGVRGQDRTGLYRLLPFLPALPQTGDSEGNLALEADAVGLLAPVDLLPLVKAVRNDQAPPRPEGTAKGGLRRRRLRAGVRQAIPDGGIVGPGWNQAPAQESKLSTFTPWLLPHHGDRLRGGNVEVGQQVGSFGQVERLGHDLAG